MLTKLWQIPALRWLSKAALRCSAFLCAAVLLNKGCWWVADNAFPDLCSNQTMQSLPSPNGQLKAVLFSRGCGATTGGSVQLSLLSMEDTLSNTSGNTFVSSPQWGHGLTGLGGLNVATHWLSDSHLQVTYASSGRVSQSNHFVAVRTGFWTFRPVYVEYKTQETTYKKGQP